MAPIIGKAHVGYLPDGKVVGISKLARVVEAYARRFQVQEKMTAEIATVIEAVLKPRCVGVVVEATHECMTTRGNPKRGASMVRSKMLGGYRANQRQRPELHGRLDNTLASVQVLLAASHKSPGTHRPRVELVMD